MNELGIALGWLAIQIALAMLPAAALHLLASRRGPVAGSWMAAASLVMIVGITALVFFPRPEIGGEAVTASTVSQSHGGNIPSALSHGGDRKESSASSPASDGFLAPTQARAIWTRLGSLLAHSAAPALRWAGIAALAALIGMGLGLFRLVLGLWAVHECRRRGTRIDDADATRLLELLKTAMDCETAVELVELPDLATPATAGWRRPMVLLPTDWKFWSESDLRAVLAHELAHIKRADYIVGLMARLMLAVHFYHPLVRWIAGRLQSQQELAADAVGARFAGGRGPYLAVLSRMALRQDREISWWPARAFSPARGTLIRRIRMLRDHEESGDRGWAPARRLLAAAVLGIIAVGVWVLPAPVQGGDEKLSPEVAKTLKLVPTTRSEAPPFDLSYISDDAMGVVAFHPAAAFRRQGMAQYAGQVNTLTALKGLDKELGFPISKCPLKVEQIDQVTAVVKLDVTVQQGKELGRMSFHCITISTVEPFDWLKLIRSWWPDAVQLRERDKVYYKVRCPWLGQKPCFYFPDNRTMVGDEESTILRLIRRPAPATPEFARGEDWKKVEHDLFAVIFNNHDGRIREAIRKLPMDDDDKPFGEFLEHTDRWMIGLADADDFLVRFLADCHDPRSAQAVATLVTKFRDWRLQDLQKPQANTNSDHSRRLELLGQMLKGLRVATSRTSVSVEHGKGVKLADLLPLIAKNGL